MDWVAVKDKLPRKNEDVLISGYEYAQSSNPRWYATARYDGRFYDPDYDIRETGKYYNPPTHWCYIEKPED